MSIMISNNRDKIFFDNSYLGNYRGSDIVGYTDYGFFILENNNKTSAHFVKRSELVRMLSDVKSGKYKL